MKLLKMKKIIYLVQNTTIRKRKTINKDKNNFKFVNLIGLDKITAKTIPIKIKLEKLQNSVF